MSIIYHIASRRDWEAALAAGAYTPAETGDAEALLCAGADQHVDIANALLAGRDGLLLLFIDANRLGSRVRIGEARGLPEISILSSDQQALFEHLRGWDLRLAAPGGALSPPPGRDPIYRGVWRHSRWSAGCAPRNRTLIQGEDAAVQGPAPLRARLRLSSLAVPCLASPSRHGSFRSPGRRHHPQPGNTAWPASVPRPGAFHLPAAS
jgi:uncharacterized protein (DUF952 family)